MTNPDLIPVQDLDRANPMVWEDEEPAQGVFLDSGETGDPLALLGTPTMQRIQEPRLPADFTVPPPMLDSLEALRSAMQAAAQSGQPGRVDLAGLEDDCREALRLMLGEGEVSGRVALDGVSYEVSESVLTGLWQLRGSDGSKWLEVAAVPDVVQRAAHSLRPAPISLPGDAPGVMNGMAVLAEVNDHAAAWDGDSEHNRVLNFTLLPMSPQDQQLLIDTLGRAELVLESGGFGHCKVMATTVRHVWAVQYLNAMGNTILDTLEVGRIPDAVLAAPEDLQGSAIRLDQILETYLP